MSNVFRASRYILPGGADLTLRVRPNDVVGFALALSNGLGCLIFRSFMSLVETQKSIPVLLSTRLPSPLFSSMMRSRTSCQHSQILVLYDPKQFANLTSVEF